MEWGELDLTLREFGLPWTDDWGGSDKELYALQMLEGGNDDLLAALDEYLFNPTVGDTSSEPIHVWRPDAFRLFVSHEQTEKFLVGDVKEALVSYGIDAFVAHDDIEPSTEWVPTILSALESCDALAAFLSDTFHRSLWTDQEIGFAMKRSILILPVKLTTDPYGFLGRYQALKPRDKTGKGIARSLFEVLVRHDLTSGAIARALVTKFLRSPSFESAKANKELLAAVPRWSPELLAALDSAAEQNDQIADAYGVPEWIARLVTKHGRES